MPRKSKVQRDQEASVSAAEVIPDPQPSEDSVQEEWVEILLSDYEALLKKAQEAQETEQMLQRWQADFENYRRRMTKDREEFTAYAAQSLIHKLLAVLDNLDRALAASGHDPASIVSGVEMIRKQQLDLLAQEGLRAINPLGELFDPNYHEAVLRCEADETTESNTIVEVMQKGYMLKERLLRPALVKVAYK